MSHCWKARCRLNSIGFIYFLVSKWCVHDTLAFKHLFLASLVAPTPVPDQKLFDDLRGEYDFTAKEFNTTDENSKFFGTSPSFSDHYTEPSGGDDNVSDDEILSLE